MQLLQWGPVLETLTHVLEEIARYVDLIGIGIVLYGFVLSTIGFIRVELGRLTGGSEGLTGCHKVRLQLGTYILTGIEFMIASDIIHTVLTRELEDLAFVASLVVVRTAISYFLGRELKELAEQR